MGITIKQTVYDPIPTGKYTARISKIEESAGQYGPQLKFVFDLQPGEDGKSRSLTGWASKNFSVRSKLYEWTLAALGPFDHEYAFNSDDLIGKKVILVVTEKVGDQGVFSVITSVLPYLKPQPAPAPASDW